METLVPEDISSLDAVHQRLAALWSKANSIITVISACENDLTNAENVKNRAQAQRELAQLREQAKEDVSDFFVSRIRNTFAGAFQVDGHVHYTVQARDVQ